MWCYFPDETLSHPLSLVVCRSVYLSIAIQLERQGRETKVLSLSLSLSRLLPSPSPSLLPPKHPPLSVPSCPSPPHSSPSVLSLSHPPLPRSFPFPRPFFLGNIIKCVFPNACMETASWNRTPEVVLLLSDTLCKANEDKRKERARHFLSFHKGNRVI